MKENSRTKAAYLNFAVTLITQVLQILLGFVVRKIFIDTLGLAYLGYNSVFTNLLQILNLADLGIGVAITSFLFKPLTEGDKDRVAALMYIYKKIYSLLGLLVFCIGIFMSFFLEILIPDATCSIGYLRILFYINLAGTVSTYFLAYKRTLLIADQKSYLTNFVDAVMYFVVSILQIIFLFVVPNYIIYLILQVAKNIVSNIILSINAEKHYSAMGKGVKKELLKEYKPQITKYVKDVFISKIGSTIFYGTDNIIISMFKGSLLAGYLSNYTMITVQLTTVSSQILSSLQATLGNYIYSVESKDKQKEMIDNYFCFNFLIGNFCFLCFALLAQSFIGLFFGQNLRLDFSTAIWLGINLMLNILLQLPSQVFVIYKLFHYDKLIVTISAVLNIIISVLLVQLIGIDGVLIGTFVTSLIYLFSRFYIISQYVYKISYSYYLKKILFYFAISTFCFVIIWYTTEGIVGLIFASFIVRMILVIILSGVLPVAILSFTKEFKFMIERLLPIKIQKICKPSIICTLGVILLIVVKMIREIN